MVNVLRLDRSVPLLCQNCNNVVFKIETDDRTCIGCGSEMVLSNEEHVWKLMKIDSDFGLQPGQII